MNGGAGRVLSSIPAFEAYEKENPDDDLFIQKAGGTWASFRGDEREFEVAGSGSFTNNVAIGSANLPTGDRMLQVEGIISGCGDLLLEAGKGIKFAGGSATQIIENSSDLLIDADDDIQIRPDDNCVIKAGNTTYAVFFGEGKLHVGGAPSSAPSSILHVCS